MAAPRGSAWPNVAQPGVRPTVATLLLCAAADGASHTCSANATRSAHGSRSPGRKASTRSLTARLVAFSIGNVTATNDKRLGVIDMAGVQAGRHGTPISTAVIGRELYSGDLYNR